jgi:hypothetical protein
VVAVDVVPVVADGGCWGSLNTCRRIKVRRDELPNIKNCGGRLVVVVLDDTVFFR